MPYKKLPLYYTMMMMASAAIAATLGLSGYLSHRYLDNEDSFRIFCRDTDRNKYIIDNCPTLHENLEFSYWTNGHFQTIYASIFRSKTTHEYHRETWSDIKLDWLKKDHSNVVLIVTGLFGNSDSIYITNMVSELTNEYDIAILNFPSKISSPALWFNLREMIHETVKHIRSLNKYKYLFGIGFSNGGNSLVNYITMDEKDKDIDALITISQGFDAVTSHQQLGGMYESVMANELCKIMNNNLETFKLKAPVKSTSIVNIEESTLCKVLGDKNPYELYDEYSSYNYFSKIAIPTMVLFSNDDPISSADTIPYHSLITNDNVILAVSEYGGHIGWSEKNENIEQLKMNKICTEYFRSVIEYKTIALKPLPSYQPLSSELPTGPVL